MTPIPNVIIYYRVDANDQHLSAISLAYQRAEAAAALRDFEHVLAGEFIEEHACSPSHVAWRQAMKVADELGSALNCLVLVPVSAAIRSGKPFLIPKADLGKCVLWELELPVMPPRDVVTTTGLG
jgi:hypothetical protein